MSNFVSIKGNLQAFQRTMRLMMEESEKILYMCAENKSDEKKILALKLNQIIELDNQAYKVFEITIGKNTFAKFKRVNKDGEE